MTGYLLTLITFIPLGAAFILALVPASKTNLFKWISLFATGCQLLLSLVAFIRFDSEAQPDDWSSAFQFMERSSWITLNFGESGWFRIEYLVGVDGISLSLVLLSALLLVIGVISSWKVTSKAKGYFLLYLILSTSIIGCFVALDLFLFYLFFEFMLLPMFFLIGIWGGPKRAYASVKFFLYTLVGSLLILVVMIALYLSVVGTEQFSPEAYHTFSIISMLEGNYEAGSILDPAGDFAIWGMSARLLAFALLIIGFAIKLPAVPVHTWLPDAHVEAPTAISVILAGILLKVGGYGFFRLAYGIFPDQAIQYAVPVAVLGLISILYGGLNALAQEDLKKLIAYSSVSHMGFVLLGLAAITSAGVTGSLFQMISHGLISGALFILVGVIYDRTGDRRIENFSGLAEKMPVFTFFVVLVFFASLGLPGLSGFVGEFLVLTGSIASDATNKLLPPWIGITAVAGIIISAAYYLWALQRMFFGKFWTRQQQWESVLTDVDRREWLMLAPLAILMLVLGIFPGLLLDPINNSLRFFVETTFSRGEMYLAL